RRAFRDPGAPHSRRSLVPMSVVREECRVRFHSRGRCQKCPDDSECILKVANFVIRIAVLPVTLGRFENLIQRIGNLYGRGRQRFHCPSLDEAVMTAAAIAPSTSSRLARSSPSLTPRSVS